MNRLKRIDLSQYTHKIFRLYRLNFNNQLMDIHQLLCSTFPNLENKFYIAEYFQTIFFPYFILTGRKQCYFSFFFFFCEVIPAQMKQLMFSFVFMKKTKNWDLACVPVDEAGPCRPLDCNLYPIYSEDYRIYFFTHLNGIFFLFLCYFLILYLL